MKYESNNFKIKWKTWFLKEIVLNLWISAVDYYVGQKLHLQKVAKLDILTEGEKNGVKSIKSKGNRNIQINSEQINSLSKWAANFWRLEISFANVSSSGWAQIYKSTET